MKEENIMSKLEICDTCKKDFTGCDVFYINIQSDLEGGMGDCAPFFYSIRCCSEACAEKWTTYKSCIRGVNIKNEEDFAEMIQANRKVSFEDCIETI